MYKRYRDGTGDQHRLCVQENPPFCVWPQPAEFVREEEPGETLQMENSGPNSPKPSADDR